MGLHLNKLEKVAELAGGAVRAAYVLSVAAGGAYGPRTVPRPQGERTPERSEDSISALPRCRCGRGTVRGPDAGR